MRNFSTNCQTRFLKVRVNGDVFDITLGMKLDRYKTHDIEIVVDRMVIEDTLDNEKRLTESINTAMNQGENVLMVLDQDSNEVRFFSRNLMCPSTGFRIRIQNQFIFFILQKALVIIATVWER
jgi:excinuclease UvrABC ATPase subunit